MSASTRASVGSPEASQKRSASRQPTESKGSEPSSSTSHGNPKGGGVNVEKASAPPKNVPVANIVMYSPAMMSSSSSASLPSKYTCDGADVWPELKWKGVPTGTQEFVIFVLALQPAENKLVYEWALAGIGPETTTIKSGQIPAGAVVGENSEASTKYSICPPSGTEETYVFQLFAIPKKLDPAPGFDPKVIREEALKLAPNAGLLTAYYKRTG
ncbi:MAG: hypothetical protein JST53_17985 [Actinobacteria bacterium]|nr:hypothetical protein [Actinomycetota bacterium]